MKEHLLNRTISFVSRCVLDMMMMGLPPCLPACLRFTCNKVVMEDNEMGEGGTEGERGRGGGK